MDFDRTHQTPARSPRISRRGLLGAAGGAAAALTVPGKSSGRQGLALAQGAAKRARFRARLPIPEVLDSDQITIRMREARVPILPGARTRMWTFGGTFPGPTIRRPAGQPTEVTFVHDLPSEVGELTVHLHGGHNTSDDDGQPGGLTRSQPKALYCDVSPALAAVEAGNDLLIAPGESRAYNYPLTEDGAPERAAFQWYHDHRLERTARNVWHGLAGMFILDDELDAGLPLPRGARDIPLMIVDRTFDAHNQLTNPFRANRHAPNDGITGELILVNGAHLPHHHVTAERYRLRVLNASQFRSYRLRLSHGVAMVQIATESGLMPRPVKRNGVLLGPAERAELVVDFARAAGRHVVLRSVHRAARSPTSLGSRTFEGPLMQFRVGPRRPDRTRVPRHLRPLPSWTRDAGRRVDRNWVFRIGGTFLPVWTINGKTFDPARSDAFPVLGTTETWRITNGTSVAHLAHIHGTDWYMLSRNGRLPKRWERCLKETFFLDPGESIVLAGHFTDHLGKFVLHCHMLDHEDHGLMTQYEVVADAAARPAADEVAARAKRGAAAPDSADNLGLPPDLESAGSLSFIPAPPPGEKLAELALLVNGRRARTVRGGALQRPVALAVPAAGPLRVTALARTRSGGELAAAVDYRH